MSFILMMSRESGMEICSIFCRAKTKSQPSPSQEAGHSERIDLLEDIRPEIKGIIRSQLDMGDVNRIDELLDLLGLRARRGGESENAKVVVPRLEGSDDLIVRMLACRAMGLI
jgi:hypothetical protein